MNRKRLNTGFTLLELMIVVLIIAIMAVAISINITRENGQQYVDDIGDKLYRQMLLAGDTALLSGNTVGLQIEQVEKENGIFYWQYGWYGYVKNQWQPLSKPSTTTALPEDITLILSVEGERIDDFSETSAADTADNNDEDSTSTVEPSPAAIKPEVIISPTGEITDFTLQLLYYADNLDDTAVFRIGVDETGELTMGDFIEASQFDSY